jgi:hypothetical protein
VRINAKQREWCQGVSLRLPLCDRILGRRKKKGRRILTLRVDDGSEGLKAEAEVSKRAINANRFMVVD